MLRRPLLALLLFSVFFSSLSSAVMTSDGGGGGGICSCGPNQACTDCRNDGCHRCTPVPVSIDLIWDSVTWALNAVFAALNLVLNQVPPITCGNGWCDGGESYLTCPLDCEPPQLLFYCGDGVCNLEGEEGRESCSSCPTDCGNCGGPCSVDTSIDTFNCGSCGNNCLADALNPKVCVGGSCATVLCGQQGLAACPQGTACTSEGYCTDTRADSLNCGVGQINCLSDPTKPRACVDGLCTPYYCSEGDEQLCNRFGGDAKCCALTEETEIRVMWPNFKLCAGTGIDPSDLENLSIPELGNGECSGSGGNSGLKCSVYCDFLQTGLAYCESEWGNCVPRDPETPCNSYCWIASGLAYCDYSNACVAVVPELPAEVVLGESMACAFTASDPRNCGGCGDNDALTDEFSGDPNQCGVGRVCENSQCKDVVPSTCSDVNPTACGSSCVDCIQSKGVGASCDGGVCRCPVGTFSCGGRCTNYSVDPSNCGGCSASGSVPRGENCLEKTKPVAGESVPAPEACWGGPGSPNPYGTCGVFTCADHDDCKTLGTGGFVYKCCGNENATVFACTSVNSSASVVNCGACGNTCGQGGNAGRPFCCPSGGTFACSSAPCPGPI